MTAMSSWDRHECCAPLWRLSGLAPRAGVSQPESFVERSYARSVELRLLGPFEIIDDNGDAVQLRGSKLNALLVVLALHAGEVVPTGRIIEDLWGDQEIREPVNALQVVISKLRRALQPAAKDDASHLVVTAAAGYSLRIDPEAV